MGLTVKDAAIAYAKAWNRLDCSEFIKLLDENAHYASQWVLEEMESKAAISDYLATKMETVKNSDSKVCAELGHTRAGRDCVFMTQGKKGEAQAVVLFEIENNKITRYDLCIPELQNVERTGIYPV